LHKKKACRICKPFWSLYQFLTYLHSGTTSEWWWRWFICRFIVLICSKIL